MLKVIVKTVDVCAAVYFTYIIGSTVYEMGKEAGKKEAATEAIPVGAIDENGNPMYKIIDGVLYKRVDKKV